MQKKFSFQQLFQYLMNSREKIRAYLTAPDLLRNQRNAFLMQFKARNINPYFRLLPKENLTDYLL